eukprot:8452306-Karenia_brevis.AAC.1
MGQREGVGSSSNGQQEDWQSQQAAAAQAEMIVREGMDHNQHSSAEDAGGSSMSVPPEPEGEAQLEK